VKRFLAARQTKPGRLSVRLTYSPGAEMAYPSARVSPIYPIGDVAEDFQLPSSGHLVFLFSRSVRGVLNRLERRDGHGVRVFASHGLASVIAVLDADADVDTLLQELEDQLCAAEVWPLQEGTVVERNTIVRHWQNDGIATTEIEDIAATNLPYEVRTEVEQFNLNLKYFWARAEQFAPEYEDLAIWLHEAVSDAAKAVASYAQAHTDPASLADPQQHYGRVSLLVEINACLTMLNSQAMGVTPPLTEATYPIGEYSLLGIGSATRAVWRIYRHMSDVFADAQHLDRLHAMRDGAPFDSGVRPYRFQMSAWADSPLSIESQDPVGPATAPRRHIVYFSSRWGFHQTVQSVSVSWQCINGNAALDWNLLTLSHEFLHAHLRELLDELLLVGTRRS